MYCTVSDLIDLITQERLIELTDDADTGAIDQTVVDKAINDAQSEIDPYLSRYDLPFSVVSPILNKLCADIAIYNLFSRRVLDTMSENINARYKNAIVFLRSVAAGQASLGDLKTDFQQSGYVNENDQVMSRKALKGF